MNLTRLSILTIGPFAVIAVAYWLAAPQATQGMLRAAPQPGLLPPERGSATPRHTLAAQCQATVTQLQAILPAKFNIVARAPFVIAGDLSRSRLQALHAAVIAPVARALDATYFERPPKHTITIVVCSTEDLFRQLAKDWDGQLETGYHGYYQRDKHRILLDLEAGNGSLAHELTHALSHADCEHLPEWFDEGLGALHEEASYSPDGRRLIGLANWRCRVTRQAAQSGSLPPLATWTPAATFREGDVGLNYAVARSLCLYLQDRQVLTRYYKELRTRPQSDPEGIATLCRVLGVKNPSQAERQFATWVKSQPGR